MKTAIKEIKIGLDFGSGIQPVGRLAIRNGIIYFEYDNDFLQTELEISPIKLANAATQAPSPKKKRINPGMANSRRKKINPMMNHRTAALKKLSMILIGFTKYNQLV